MTEPEARAMRDYVFEIPTTDKNWSYCCENWMRKDSILWLREQLTIMASKPAMSYKSKFNAT